MNINDLVRYTQKHYFWLMSANEWPRKKMGSGHQFIVRAKVMGKVIDLEDRVFHGVHFQLVHVLWPENQIKVHLADNLETI